MRTISLVSALALSVTACSATPFDGAEESRPGASSGVGEDGALGVVRSADIIAPFDDPSGLLGQVSRRLADNIAAADVGQTFGVTDENVPYPDSYWPMSSNGIDMQWNGSEPSPLEKYMRLANPAALNAARRWNRANHGEGVPNMQPWYGICQGWAAAAILERPVTHAVEAKLDGGRVRACADGEGGCIRFEIGDVNGLLAEVYSDSRARLIGARCDTASGSIVRDEHGRIDRNANGAGCKGLNPGSLLIVLNHRLKRDQRAFVIDVQNDYNTDQIWNQPAYRYTVNRYEPLTLAQAANLVASGQRQGSMTEYPWNAQARGFVFLDVTLHWVVENGPNRTYVSGLEASQTMRVVAVVELDAEPSAPNAQIIGGEYLEDAQVGATRLRVNPFVWIPTGPGPERPYYRGHNPYVRSSLVVQLAALGH